MARGNDLWFLNTANFKGAYRLIDGEYEVKSTEIAQKRSQSDESTHERVEVQQTSQSQSMSVFEGYLQIGRLNLLFIHIFTIG